MQKMALEATGLTQKLNGEVVLDHVSFEIRQGETWAITGSSGSGKTALARALAGQHFVQGHISYDLPDQFGDRPTIAFIEQQHHFLNASNTRDFYYQQRYNSFDAEDSLTVSAYLAETLTASQASTIPGAWALHTILDKPLIQLSNGENKRLQLAIAMAGNPAVVILDSPFTGLDVAGREILEETLGRITAQNVLVIIIARATGLPAPVTHVLLLEKGKILYKGPRSGFTPPVVQSAARTVSLKSGDFSHVPDEIIFMKDVSVVYGEKKILDNINWTVCKGEQWSINGPNGAGKSTLLSLITGDNPQAYSNDVRLFSRQRGTGESIWDLKKKIGFVSPELHLSFDRSNTAFDVIASGFFDTIGLFRQVSAEQQQHIAGLMEMMDLAAFANKPLLRLSLGQQRLVLLARALVKNPPLLILDEPCQGLDDEQSSSIRGMVENTCSQNSTTLLYISHYAVDIPKTVTHHLRLEQGRIV